MLDYLYFVFELLAFISCLRFYKKLDQNFRIFLPFLSFVIIYEYVNLFNWLNWHNTNAWCNNFEGIIEMIVFGQFMASLDKRKAYRKKVYIAIAAGIVLTLIDMFFIQGFWTLGTIAIVVQNTILATLVCIYYYNLINNSDEYLDLLSYPPFYATIGLLFYALTNFFYYAFFSYMMYVNNYHFYLVAKVICDVGCIFLYSLLAVSFLCFSRTKKLS
ncbi:hypothetical protein SNE25_02735 [Mucilaginibacter sabulilitoris]|uniref:Lycopene cyclase domain-containing protein n=1 Tax=Mucilaginibacter sabulilitoris TaxID=1173583 RepID=A0ABZ0TND1_9SPHI|nr:hypothetical protein [Mucilaginibacter sabulilitoris]WPU94437.1 hypothetical protein SNE25_02735 [Mucilaginibacter sabulilitoris]